MKTRVVAPVTRRGYRPLASLAGMPSPKTLDYHILDVFTDRPFAGNPLAVVLGAERLSAQQLQQLAREFHLSETAFPVFGDAEADAVGADYRLRIFTPEVELPFAGHPSVGSAWLMVSSGRVEPRDGEVLQLCGEGRLRLVVDESGATLNGGRPTCGPVLEAQPLLAAVGLDVADLADPAAWPPRTCSAGLGFAVVRVRRDALERCEPDLVRLRRDLAHPSPATGVYVVSWDDLADGVDARMFAGDVGVAEDAATGSAALALGVYLATSGGLPEGGRLDVRQGVAMGRPSLLRVGVEAKRGTVGAVTVSGSVVPVAQGTIAVPHLSAT
jgi:trans-2,3-dihydro-3-hydroxyanthranilate isomerase